MYRQYKTFIITFIFLHASDQALSDDINVDPVTSRDHAENFVGLQTHLISFELEPSYK